MPGSDDEVDEIEDYQSDSVIPAGKGSRGLLAYRPNPPQDKSESELLDIMDSGRLESRAILVQTPTPYSPSRFKVDSPPPSTADADISRLELRVLPSAEDPSQVNDASDADRIELADSASAEPVDKPTAFGDTGPAHAVSSLPSQHHSPSRVPRADDSGEVPETQESAPSTHPISLVKVANLTHNMHFSSFRLSVGHVCVAIFTVGSLTIEHRGVIYSRLGLTPFGDVLMISRNQLRIIRGLPT